MPLWRFPKLLKAVEREVRTASDSTGQDQSKHAPRALQQGPANPGQKGKTMMSDTDLKVIVRRFFDEAWNRGAIDALGEYISANNVNHGHSGNRPYGPEPMRKTMKNWHTGFPDFQYHIEAIICENDLVAARTTFTGTHGGIFTFESKNLAPTGKSIGVSEMFFFRLVEGKVVEFWATWDRLSVLSQLGATG